VQGIGGLEYFPVFGEYERTVLYNCRPFRRLRHSAAFTILDPFVKIIQFYTALHINVPK
jgi:hypothetical protein